MRTNRNRISRRASPTRCIRARRADRFALIVNFAGCSLALETWGTCRFPVLRALLARPPFAIIDFRPLIPGGRCSQVGVKFPTGGKGGKAQHPERLPSPKEGSADSGRLRKPRL